MVQGAVHRFEEDAAVGAVIRVGEFFGRVVEAAVGPGVVAGEHDEERFHRGAAVRVCHPRACPGDLGSKGCTLPIGMAGSSPAMTTISVGGPGSRMTAARSPG